MIPVPHFEAVLNLIWLAVSVCLMVSSLVVERPAGWRAAAPRPVRLLLTALVAGVLFPAISASDDMQIWAERMVRPPSLGVVFGSNQSLGPNQYASSVGAPAPPVRATHQGLFWLLFDHLAPVAARVVVAQQARQRLYRAPAANSPSRITLAIESRGPPSPAASL
jgi:hypothetical protein